MSSAMLIAGHAGVEPVVLANDLTVHIVVSEESAHIAVVLSLDPDVHTELGRIISEFSGARLEAIDSALKIRPGQAHAYSTSPANSDPRTEEYELKPEANGRVEVFLLRHGDVITSSKSIGDLTCMWNASHIQVDSSAALIEPSKSRTDIADTPEDEEIDDATESSEQVFTAVPVTQPKSQPTATPRLSHQHSVVVQETPTAVRTVAASEFHEGRDKSGSSSNTPRPQAVDTEGIGFSTAPTGHSQHEDTTQNKTEVEDVRKAALTSRERGSPEVRVIPSASKKRSKPGLDAGQLETDAEQSQTNKRARRSVSNDQDIKDSDHGDTTVDTSSKTRSSRGKKRLSEVAEASPMRSTRNSSQQSATATAADTYQGESPHVAFSNSAIEKSSPTVRFLKRHKGSVTESVEGECNILCTRDGALVKTTKIVQAIARGIPIVTDRWLQESAGAGRFLDLSTYKPSFPEQEEEWKFDFAAVWNKPQKIFEGYTIYLTSGFKDKNQYGSVCKAAGAKVTNSKKQTQSGNVIVIAKEEDDPDAEKLMQDGVTCYTKDLLTTSILRGKVELDSDEFKIGVAAEAVEPEVTTRKRSTRKSTRSI